MTVMVETYGLMIDGREEPSASGDTFVSTDPSSGQALAHVALGGASDVDRAVAAARDAYRRFWRSSLPRDRADILRAIAPALLAAADELVELGARDGGLPVSGVRGDLRAAADYFNYYAGLADKVSGETIPLGPDFIDYTVREPWGVCGVIVPFNSPFQLVARSAAAALAAGNTVVVKTGEQAPLGPALLARVAHDAGLPAGTLQIVSGYGDAGARLAGHPDVGRLTFTGSVPTARLVMAAAAEHMTPVCTELGGKSPQIVFADADIDLAAETIVNSLVYYAGQTCSAGTRVLVERAAQANLVEALRERVRGKRIGAAVDDPDVGPLVSSRQRDNVLAALSANAGAGRLVVGGGAPEDAALSGGYFVAPTIFDEVDPASALARDELFAPVLAITAFEGDGEALRIANDTEFGLAAGVWTRDLGRAHRMGRDVEAGQIFVNNYRGGIEIPFGGYKMSGNGREKGIAGFLEYTQIKNVCVAI
jgi:aldehyde dehydrogenase (NAD+)